MIKTYRTLVKNDVTDIVVGLEYATGMVEGIMLTQCELGYGFLGEAPRVTESGTILTARCDPEAYDDFKAIVQWLYPGLCEFDYELN